MGHIAPSTTGLASSGNALQRKALDFAFNSRSSHAENLGGLPPQPSSVLMLSRVEAGGAGRVESLNSAGLYDFGCPKPYARGTMSTKKNGRGGPRVGSGRPKKVTGEKQRHAVSAKLTDAEHRKLSEAAGREPLGTYVRRLILRHLARRKK
jgi:hypothetical protein